MRKASAIAAVDTAELGIADADTILQHGRKHWLKIAGRAADNLQHFGRRRLLLPSFVQFAGKPNDLRFLATMRRIGTCLDIRLITPLRPWRLSTSPFDRLAACSGAPLHRVPV